MKIYKNKFIIILTIIISFMFNNTIFAAGDDQIDIWGTAQDFIDTGTSEVGMTQKLDEALSGIIGVYNINEDFEGILDVVWGIGLLVIVVATIVLGIKYIMVNPEEKSRIKQATTPYVLGVVIIFGALTIWKLMIYILESML